MNNNNETIKQLIKELYPYAKKELGFNEDCIIKFTNDPNNSNDPLGKTAQYEPGSKTITLFIADRHPKDILRSLSHELVHHNQNCNGAFDGANTTTEEGYAQSNEVLRKLEKEAYLNGNMIFRDWEDQRKKKKRIKEANYSKGRFTMDWKDKLFAGRNKKLTNRLLENQGLPVNEDRNAAYAAYETLLGELGAETLLDELYQAMSSDEAMENFEYIARMHDIDIGQGEAEQSNRYSWLSGQEEAKMPQQRGVADEGCSKKGKLKETIEKIVRETLKKKV